MVLLIVFLEKIIVILVKKKFSIEGISGSYLLIFIKIKK